MECTFGIGGRAMARVYPTTKAPLREITRPSALVPNGHLLNLAFAAPSVRPCRLLFVASAFYAESGALEILCTVACSLLLFLFVLTSAALGAVWLLLHNPASNCGAGALPNSYGEQRRLLSNYCRLDFEGARWNPSGWSRFKPYTSLRANPEFSRVVIVTRFDIETPEQPERRVHGNYRTMGYYQ